MEYLSICNNFILLSKEESISINVYKLQCFMFFVYKEYYYQFKEYLLEEKFEIIDNVVCIQSIYRYFGVNDSPITRYYKFNGVVSVLSPNKELQLLKIINICWNKYKLLDQKEIILLANNAFKH